MKICTCCKKKKHVSHFSWKIKAKGKRHFKCKDCHSKYVANHYLKHKTLYKKRGVINKKASVLRNNGLVRTLKHNKPCKDCRRKYPYYVMDYDHLDPSTKIAAVSTLNNYSISQKRILEEIAKCDLICSNCHRQREHDRRQEKKKNKPL